MNVPDYVSPIIGYRAWQWDGLKLQSLGGQSWQPGQPLAAECVRAPDYHQAPHEDCTCGVYAAKSLDELCQLGYAGHSIYGEVHLWGTLVEHEFGWRAQYAYPKTLVLMPKSLVLFFSKVTSPSQEEDDVLKVRFPLIQYGVDVFVFDGEGIVRVFAKSAEVEPPDLDLDALRALANPSNLEVLLSRMRSRLSIPPGRSSPPGGGSAPPAASLWVPLGAGPRPVRPREMALTS